MALVDSLGASYGHERSVKISDGRLNDQRVLLSLHKSSLGPDPVGRLLDMCGGLGLPAAQQRGLAADTVEADIVHFGFEQGGSGPVYKIYLEYAASLRRALAGPGPAPRSFVVHRAVKWNAADTNECVSTTYTYYPVLGASGIRGKLDALFRGNAEAISFRAAAALLQRALLGASEEDIFYLSVKDDDTPRESYDIRLYDAGLLIADIYDVIFDVCSHFSVPEALARQFVESEGSESVGHISGGRDRCGSEFVTFYFGVVPREG